MSIEALGYFGVNSDRLDDWADFGTRLLGMQIVERSKDFVKFRMDDRKQRFIVRRATPDTGLTGWQLANSDALNAFGARLEAAGVRCEPILSTELDQRAITAGISFRDPNGTRLEAFCGAESTTDPFVPGRTISGFRTGGLGAGHIVYQTPHVAPLQKFYHDVMGFHLSDYFDEPFHASFYHVNPRHHSLAFAESPKTGIHHIMVEFNQLDDVGQGYDLVRVVPGMVATTFGRHINDLMISYYVRSPDGFFIECGWGGRSIDVETWKPFKLAYGPSMWGHDRDWLSPQGKIESAELREKAARDGLTQPVQVSEGNYQLGPGPRGWWEK